MVSGIIIALITKNYSQKYNIIYWGNQTVIMNFVQRALAVFAFLVFTPLSNAALFDCSSEPGYCIGEGDTVIFKYTGTESSMGLFGTLQVVGDSILASPTDFRAESLNGDPVDPYGFTADENGLMFWNSVIT